MDEKPTFGKGTDSRFPGWAAGVAVFLVAIGLAVVIFTLRAGPRIEPLPSGAAEVTLVSPAANAEFTHDTRFVWRSVRGATDYVLQLLNEAGEVVWSQVSTDTMLVLPASAPVIGGMRYSWLVRANLRDGTTANSSARSIVARE